MEALGQDDESRAGEEHGHEGKEDPGADDESELRKPLEIREQEREKRHRRGQRGGGQSTAGPDYGFDQGVFDGHVAPSRLPVARKDMNAEVYPQPEEDGEQAYGDLVEIADDQIGEPEGPGETHEQRDGDHDRRHELAKMDGDEDDDAQKGEQRCRLQIVNDHFVLVASVLEAALIGILDGRVKAPRVDNGDGAVQSLEQFAGELLVRDDPGGIEPQDYSVLLLGEIVLPLEAIALVTVVLLLEVREIQ